MPPSVSGQRRLLESLICTAEAEPAFRWLELGGSLARGAGDELSDIDAGLGVADESWTEGLAAAEAAVRAASPVSDAFRQRFPGKDGQPAWHLCTLYDSGLQLSLVVMPASQRAGLPPQSVALYDLDGQLARSWTPDNAQADADTMREWTCLGWVALGDVLALVTERGQSVIPFEPPGGLRAWARARLASQWRCRHQGAPGRRPRTALPRALPASTA